MSPIVSVIIPSYNYAAYVSNAIRSVLEQTFTDFEVIVVDDGSTDNTREVVAKIDDPRLAYIYQENRGLPGARNTGIRAATGKYLAFLDADDRFHPQKLALQTAYLDANPQVGLAYNARFLVDMEGNILFLQRPPKAVYLKDLVSGYPFTPSDVMVRREIAGRIGLFDESFILNSEDLNFHLRLALAGVEFGGVPRALTYRQVHTRRVFRNIAGKLETYLRALDTAFKNPLCPPEVLDLQNTAYGNHYLSWATQAAAQGELERSSDYLRHALHLKPDLQDENGRRLVSFLVHFAIRDGSEHEDLLRDVIEHFSQTLPWLKKQAEVAVGRGYLLRAGRDLLWGRQESAEKQLERAADRHARIDQEMLHTWADQFSSYAVEFGGSAAHRLLEVWVRRLPPFASAGQIRRLKSYFLLNQAFSDYRSGRYEAVPGAVLRVVFADPQRLKERGVLSILAKSLVGMTR